METINRITSAWVGFSLVIFLGTVAMAGQPPAAAVKVGDAAGGALSGTYPNPSLADGAVSLPNLNAGSAEAGQFLKSPDGSGMAWSDSLPFLEITGHLDAAGDKPEIISHPVFCSSPNNRALDGSNQVRGQIVMAGFDEQCSFTWAPGTEYGSGTVYCVASVSGDGPPSYVGAFAGPTGMVINKGLTPTPLAITYICMGPKP